MRIAIGIVSLFPGGGLQRDCLRVIELLRERGHAVDVFAASVDPSLIVYPALRLLPSSAWSNHGRDLRFGQDFAAATRGAYDVVIGFNKLPGLDVLYCADPCYAARRLWAWVPRARVRRRLEASCFSEPARTEIALLTRAAADVYTAMWNTRPERVTVLPPSIARTRIRPDLREVAVRAQLRAAIGLDATRITWLWIGSQPHTKGLDRVLTELRHHDDVQLLVVGATGAKAARYRSRAERVGVSGRVTWLGFRDDVPELMAVSDLMVHPARTETTGQALLEALANGLPIVCTDVCGFAGHVAAADAGVVLASPFTERDFGAALQRARDTVQRTMWSRSALAFASRTNLTDGLLVFADLVERAGRVKEAGRGACA
jgi:UDP-glucose:(heptosyl)LPS alpha-1,3-glucosyltransferase